ncbi:hypothetical protein BDS110ZK12_73240 [Bradyrhizobium diazoefficiens]|uniref:Uncharacterized protein n=1 Tax=Bradyrhizobium diazoefficiens TaxID=1355477 RepID=A0A809Y022_9BRAD|nr:hypothetical protein XF2B_73810 [Bradyrhizobium diazoefficiens]BCE77226.1 hypothetical protein XF8B_73370 [Bradyrhizobium diazoefficiens]BCF20689.1 hypothetical protein XF13B_73800 [Bradyrhizobium diazoefficiens]
MRVSRELGGCRRDAGALQHPDLALLCTEMAAQALDLVAPPVELSLGRVAWLRHRLVRIPVDPDDLDRHFVRFRLGSIVRPVPPLAVDVQLERPLSHVAESA